MLEAITELYKYNKDCNQRLINLISDNREKVNSKTTSLFSHILNAHAIWNARLVGEKDAYLPWFEHPVEDYEKIDQRNHTTTFGIMKNAGLAKEVVYVNVKGVEYTNTVQDILLHVVNHSTYHRGQIASDLKASGISPIITDYIAYKR